MAHGQHKLLRRVLLAMGRSRKRRHGTEFRDASDGLAPPDQVRGPAPPAGPPRLFAEARLRLAKASLRLGANGHKLSRRALLAGACAIPLARHCEERSDAAIQFGASAGTESGLPRCARNDDTDAKWDDALARFREADGALDALVHCPNQRTYDRALGRHCTALSRLLRTPAPDLAAAAEKLDLIVRHQVFEALYGKAAIRVLRRDIGRFARLTATASA